MDPENIHNTLTPETTRRQQATQPPPHQQQQATPQQPTLQQVYDRMQSQISHLQSKLDVANQQYQNLAREQRKDNLEIGKPDTFSGRNALSWLKSLRNLFDMQTLPPSEKTKISYAVCYLTGDGMQWWDLVTLNAVDIGTFEEFERELLKHLEPVNRELNARKYSVN